MRRLALFVLVALAVCAGARFAAAEVQADGRVTVSFTEAGTYPFAVPAGVTSIHVVAVGAPGGASYFGGPGGQGGFAEADLAVTPSQTLNVYVGGSGGEATDRTFSPGGFNGGGDGGGSGSSGEGSQTLGAGGGGGSDVRTGGPADLGSRLIVAAGGGGSSDKPGADAGQTAVEAPAQEFSGVGSCTGGGGANGEEGGAGGLGMSSYPGEEPVDGEEGTLGQGGSGPNGGGGGGGLAGGGGGGGFRDTGSLLYDGCGGGGGSNGFGPGASATASGVSDATEASVTISYVPASAAPGGGGAAGAPTAPTAPAAPTIPPAPESAIGGLAVLKIQHGDVVTSTVQINFDRSILKAQLLYQRATSKRARLAGKRAAVLGSVVKAPVNRGYETFVLKLSKRGRKLLASLHKLKLQVAVTVTPPTGAAASASRPVTLKPYRL